MKKKKGLKIQRERLLKLRAFFFFLNYGMCIGFSDIILLHINRLQYCSFNMYWGTQKFMWSVLLQYSLYFCGLEQHLQYFQGMPVHNGILFNL